MGKAEEFETGHQDRVTVLHTNFNGTRILTASIDHRIKVWDRNVKTGERTLIDTFTAHDSDIRDVCNVAPSIHPSAPYLSITNDRQECSSHILFPNLGQIPASDNRLAHCVDRQRPQIPTLERRRVPGSQQWPPLPPDRHDRIDSPRAFCFARPQNY